MSTISRLLPAFNRLAIQPSTLRLSRSYATKVLPAAKGSSSTKKTTPEKKNPGKKVAAGKKEATSAKTTRKTGDVKKKSGKASSEPERKRKPKRLETILTKQPSPALSAWTLFIQANKDKFHGAPKKDGKFNLGDVTTELSKKWKELPEAERKKYEEQAIQEKFRYQEELNKLLASATVKDFKTENSLRRAEGKSKLKDPNAPKGAKNPFMFFSISERLKDTTANTMPITEFSKTLGETWKNMSDSQKEPYNELAKADKVRYYAEMKVYDPERFEPKPPKTPKAAKAAN